MVSVPMIFDETVAEDRYRRRLNPGHLNSFAFRQSNTRRAIGFLSPLILWPGELKSSTIINIAVLNISGRARHPPMKWNG